jgi:hypothetical protein
LRSRVSYPAAQLDRHTGSARTVGPLEPCRQRNSEPAKSRSNSHRRARFGPAKWLAQKRVSIFKTRGRSALKVHEPTLPSMCVRSRLVRVIRCPEGWRLLVLWGTFRVLGNCVRRRSNSGEFRDRSRPYRRPAKMGSGGGIRSTNCSPCLDGHTSWSDRKLAYSIENVGRVDGGFPPADVHRLGTGSDLAL